MSTSVFLGIGGAGMRGLAYLLRENGENIIGFDDAPEETEVSLEEAMEQLQRADRLVYTDAAVPAHPLRTAAEKQGIQQTPYQIALGEFSKHYNTIAITGTHGKSSTTALLAHICMVAGLDPSVLIGASMPTLQGKHAQKGNGMYFIVEADEYRKHFLELTPAHSIITTIDFDHPDAFSSLQDVEKAYEEFIMQIQPDGFLVIPEHEKSSHPNISFPIHTKIVTQADVPNIKLPLPGSHMRMNAALALAVAEILGVPKQVSLQALQTFPGLSRRFELLGTKNGCDIRSDYGHHPAEITATIKGAREVYTDTAITAVFEAHMPLRLRTFLPEFADALSHADRVVIVAPFVPAGRDENAQEDALLLRDMLLTKGTPAKFTEKNTDFLQDVQEGSVALLFSAGGLDAAVRKAVIQS